MPADVDRVVLRVVAEADWNDVWLAVRTDGRETPEPLPGQVRDLGRGERAQGGGTGEYGVGVSTRSSIRPTRSRCAAFVTRLISFHS